MSANTYICPRCGNESDFQYHGDIEQLFIQPDLSAILCKKTILKCCSCLIYIYRPSNDLDGETVFPAQSIG